jgi:drug/metabolite transporter (DMT)-like permease
LCAIWGVPYFFIKLALDDLSPAVIAWTRVALAASLVVAAIVLLPAAAMSVPTHVPSTLAIVSVVVLGIVCTALGLLLYFYLINEAGAARASVVAYINPAIAALFGVLLLHEPFGINSVVGLLMILLGSWLATHKTRQTAATEPTTSRGPER